MAFVKAKKDGIRYFPGAEYFITSEQKSALKKREVVELDSKALKKMDNYETVKPPERKLDAEEAQPQESPKKTRTRKKKVEVE